jgi:uncharacterized membrane protein YccC
MNHLSQSLRNGLQVAGPRQRPTPAPSETVPDSKPATPTVDPRWIPWIFAAKTTVSALLALLIAFTFNLDEPQWTLLTVLIVSQPRQDGLVFAKSFFRIIGTLIGATMALMLVSLAAQERVIFLGALSIWIGLCAFGSAYAQGWAAYGFVLSGYTAAIVGIPGALAPAGAFYLAVARVTEITIGIVVTAGISALIMPQSFGDLVRRSIADLRDSVTNCVGVVLRSHARPGDCPSLLRKTAALEQMRYSAIFGDEKIRRARHQIANLTAAAVRVVGTIECLATGPQTLRQTAGGGVSDIVSVLDEATRAVRAWQASELAAIDLRCQLRALYRRLLLSLQSSEYVLGDLDPAQAVLAAQQLKDMFDALAAFALAFDRVGSEATPPGPNLVLDRLSYAFDAIVIGLRSALAVGIPSLFWILTAWQRGSTAMVLAAIATAVLATMGHAADLAIAGALIFALAAVPSFVVVDVLLPLASDFTMFALAVAPILFLCALLMAFKRTMIIGFLSGLMFAYVSAFQNRMVYDPVALVNIVIAAVIACTTALALWSTLFPDTPYSLRRRFRRTAVAAFAARPLSLDAFESRLGGALVLLATRIAPPQPSAAEILDAGTGLLAAGRTMALAAANVEPARVERNCSRLRNAISACLTELGRTSINTAGLRASVASLNASRCELALSRVLVRQNRTERELSDVA